MDRQGLDNFDILFPESLVQKLVVPFFRGWGDQVCNSSQQSSAFGVIGLRVTS